MTKNKYIEVKGAKVHNLKNIDVKIPRNKFVVVTGLSGSGKSSLAFDTIYAEGQRRYVESLSSYARQFLGRIHKPEVDFIKGIPPAIAIEQKVNTRNPRSTVGTSTEIYDYLKLLYARIGKTYSPVSGNIVKKHAVKDVVNYLQSLKDGLKGIILFPLIEKEDRSLKESLQILEQQGYSRLEYKNEISKIEEFDFTKSIKGTINIVVDRIITNSKQESLTRYADSIETAFFEGKGICILKIFEEDNIIEKIFSNVFEADNIVFEEPNVNMFSFNNPIGACSRCEGFGSVIGIDENLVIPNKGLSIYDESIACWRGEKMGEWKNKLVMNANKFDFPIHKPYFELEEKYKKLLWSGNKYFKGLDSFFKHLEEKSYKIQYRVMLSRYRGKTICPDCYGTRLKKEAGYVKVDSKSIHELVLMPLDQLQTHFNNLILNENEKLISKRILNELNSRIDYLINVGLGYLTLNRLSSTLSGGESQRINLATSLGSSLVGSIYILDEPSIGLHSRDSERLIKILNRLNKIGNTILVVEHDEDIIKAADEIIDIGPLAGRNGGEVVFQGNHRELLKATKSYTTKYLTKKLTVPTPKKRRSWNKSIDVFGAFENNLKNINVKIPLDILCVITGVSGSGKSSLIKNILYPGLKKMFDGFSERTGLHSHISGDIKVIENVEFVDQNPIGRSSRSNPVTYLKAYDEIRKLYSSQQLSKYNGFKPSHFSFNIDGGRCEECQGEGIIRVEMQFMADVELVCDSCNGNRFKDEVLEVKYKNNNISDVLNMTVNEAIEFFSEGKSSTSKKIVQRLQPLSDVGLGYIKLGQSSSTLSGGESQRVKLASFLSKENTGKPMLFIFDEPTTGLHFHDITTLLKAINALIAKGNSVIIIEHNLEVIKNADWIIDLGPEGGNNGGEIIFEGVPEDLINLKKSYTGKYLKEKLE
jgi:excinuclease ABC subunit A